MDTRTSDLGPEGAVSVSKDDSPTGKPLLLITNEISSTIAIYQVVTAP